MRNNGYQNYFDNEVLAASPLKLIQMLYVGALDSIKAARRHLRLGEIRARSRAITKAMRIVTELLHCLNHTAGGDLSRNLAGLYGYVMRLLILANTKQEEAPLVEAEALLSTLSEAWIACAPPAPPPSFTDSELVLPDAERESTPAVW
jgi:flagellar protein FliS